MAISGTSSTLSRRSSGSAGLAASAIETELKLDGMQSRVDRLKLEVEGVSYRQSSTAVSLADQLNATRSELQETTSRLRTALAAVDRLQLQTAALTEPWREHAGDGILQCALDHRCTNYVDAGKTNLTALSSVAACRDHCRERFPATNFFAFHNEHGMLAFMLDPKGRCRCYEMSPCDRVADGGYTLWTTAATCSPDLLSDA